MPFRACATLGLIAVTLGELSSSPEPARFVLYEPVEGEAVRNDPARGLQRDLRALSRDLDSASSSLNEILVGLMAEFERGAAALYDSKQRMRDRLDRLELALQQLVQSAEELQVVRSNSSHTLLWIISGCLWTCVFVIACQSRAGSNFTALRASRVPQHKPSSNRLGNTSRRSGERASVV